MISLSKLKKMKQQHEKIACLTAYDASQAYWAAEAGVEVILVGDSLGMVVQGHETTLPVTLDDMVYHTRMVQRQNTQAWCIADFPFMADQDMTTTLTSAGRLMKEGLANMVKLEGGQRVLDKVAALSALGIPVCGHLGLLPQSVQKKGYAVVGKDSTSALMLQEEAIALEEAGAEMLVLECVPSELAHRISQSLTIPVIGIGAGSATDGQVLVFHDLVGLTMGRLPSFAKNFLQETDSIQQAISCYVSDVKQGVFPIDQPGVV
ncbi:3-methyl-2-oxobutanoate hydroxymethyltransferase [Hydrogenovibrio sp. SC-1]|uniref:3-methyl-2-oxobutanoate hydroxymethyltransferase n=1 Tax=Hydrogenovibrio sp. SC-1 TaxID=2065820 RepID=UPI000C7CC161|nr:3-methyl-2-oxobutanoate hydroxymethyltransferase [Hydrogenovibrio sp. SC-1]PLA75183.1 3-methyl-2-oxobutanoate hydroxymethyltransferase [Hydrogenovibrio sp. SC-1]